MADVYAEFMCRCCNRTGFIAVNHILSVEKLPTFCKECRESFPGVEYDQPGEIRCKECRKAFWAQLFHPAPKASDPLPQRCEPCNLTRRQQMTDRRGAIEYTRRLKERL